MRAAEIFYDLAKAELVFKNLPQRFEMLLKKKVNFLKLKHVFQ